MNRVYVGNLNRNVEKGQLLNFFSKFYSSIQEVWVARSPPGFAFIVFHNDSDIDAFIAEFNGQVLDGAKIRVERASSSVPVIRRGRSRSPPQARRSSPDRYREKRRREDSAERSSRHHKRRHHHRRSRSLSSASDEDRDRKRDRSRHHHHRRHRSRSNSRSPSRSRSPPRDERRPNRRRSQS